MSCPQQRQSVGQLWLKEAELHTLGGTHLEANAPMQVLIEEGAVITGEKHVLVIEENVILRLGKNRLKGDGAGRRREWKTGNVAPLDN